MRVCAPALGPRVGEGTLKRPPPPPPRPQALTSFPRVPEDARAARAGGHGWAGGGLRFATVGRDPGPAGASALGEGPRQAAGARPGAERALAEGAETATRRSAEGQEPLVLPAYGHCVTSGPRPHSPHQAPRGAPEARCLEGPLPLGPPRASPFSSSPPPAQRPPAASTGGAWTHSPRPAGSWHLACYKLSLWGSLGAVGPRFPGIGLRGSSAG